MVTDVLSSLMTITSDDTCLDTRYTTKVEINEHTANLSLPVYAKLYAVETTPCHKAPPHCVHAATMDGGVASEMYKAYVGPVGAASPPPELQKLPDTAPPTEFTEGFDYTIDSSRLEEEGTALTALERHLTPRRAVSRNVAVALYLEQITFDPHNPKIGERFGCNKADWAHWLCTVLGKRTEPRKTIITDWYVKNDIETQIVNRNRDRRLEYILIVIAHKLGGFKFEEKPGTIKVFRCLSQFEICTLFKLSSRDYDQWKTIARVKDNYRDETPLAADLSAFEAVSWFTTNKTELLSILSTEITAMLKPKFQDVCT